jgi:rubrerythrin
MTHEQFIQDFWVRYHEGDTDIYVCEDCGYTTEWGEFPELFGCKVCPSCRSENLKEE